MARISFVAGRQRAFVDAVLSGSGLSIDALAKHCRVHPRTLRDWRREKFTIRAEVALALSGRYGVPITDAEEVPDFWYAAFGASAGGKRRVVLHGPPGTPEGRRRGGIISQERRRLDPERYRAIGCNVRKRFRALTPSENLAELCGILLGDGGITAYQVKVTLSALVDREYVGFVSNLMESCFGQVPHCQERKGKNAIVLTISGRGLVSELSTFGLREGHKIRNRIRIPSWIRMHKKFLIPCMRGLFDTDGGFYLHAKPSGKYLGWCFSSYSPPLLQDMSDALRLIGIDAKNSGGRRLYVYRRSAMARYMQIVGSHNPKNVRKFLKLHRYGA